VTWLRFSWLQPVAACVGTKILYGCGVKPPQTKAVTGHRTAKEQIKTRTISAADAMVRVSSR